MENEYRYYSEKLSDFDYNFFENKLAICEGKNVKIIQSGKIIFEKRSKAKSDFNHISFSKENSQLFFSNMINISDEDSKIYNLEIKKNKIKKIINMDDKFAKIVFLNNGFVIYLSGDLLLLIKAREGIASRTRNVEVNDGRVRLNGNEKWIVVDVRDNLTKKNIISVYNLFLHKVDELEFDSNIISCALDDDKFYLLTEERDIFLKNIEDNEMPTLIEKGLPNDIKKIFYQKELILAKDNGELIFWKSKEVVKKHTILVEKIRISGNKCVSMDKKHNLLIWERSSDILTKENFMEYFNIHKSYVNFFNETRKTEIIDNLNEIFNSGEEFAPDKKNIFKALSYDLNKAKVLILGKDPYFQKGAATGLAFEVKDFSNWSDTIEQRSLQNIIKVLYKSSGKNKRNFKVIREKIENGTFQILPPDELFKHWEKEGVILLNSFLTVKIDNGKNSSGSHMEYWDKFCKDLITFISENNNEINYFLWGKHAKKYKKYIKNGKIFESRHPSMSFGKHKDDFLYFKGFKETKEIINWLGYS